MKLVGLVCLLVVSFHCVGMAQSEAPRQRPADWVFQPKHFEVELKWKQRLESNLLWMIQRAENPTPVISGAPLVGVYGDAGVWPLGARSIVSSLEAAGVTCEVLDWSRLLNGNLERYDALIVPGGFSWFEKLSAGKNGEDAIRDYVSNGGSYLGICAGAYFASKDVHWEGGKYPYDLQLFDGIAEGAIDEIAEWPKSGAAVVTITREGKARGLAAVDGKAIYYSGGCRFVGGTDVTVLANYSDGTPAIIRCPFGPEKKGTVVLTGLHFERPAPAERGEKESRPSPPSAPVFSRLLDLKFPRPDAEPEAFERDEFKASVTAKTADEQWLALQRSLRLRLNAVRKANAK